MCFSSHLGMYLCSSHCVVSIMLTHRLRCCAHVSVIAVLSTGTIIISVLAYSIPVLEVEPELEQ